MSVRRSPNTSIRPESGSRMCRIIRSVVVLPEPLGPMKPKTDPAGTRSDRSFTATWLPKRLSGRESGIEQLIAPVVMSESGHATAPDRWPSPPSVIGGTESNPPRPMSFLDLLNIPGALRPAAVAGRTLVAYVQDAPDWKENKRIGHIWRVPVSGRHARATDARRSRRIEPALVA